MSATETAEFSDARPVLVGWACALAAALLLVAGWQAGLAGYIGVVRRDSPWTYLKAAERFEVQNNWNGAIGMLEEAARRGPDSPTPHERMGMIYYQQRSDWNAAIASFREALVRGSTSLDVRGKTMWSLIHLKRYDDAVIFGQRCIDEGQDSPYFPRYIGEALFRAGKHAEAMPHLEKALQQFPTDMLLMERLLACYGTTGESEKAKQMEKRIRQNEG